MIAFGIVIVSITSATLDKVKSNSGTSIAVVDTYPALGLPGYSDYGWNDCEAATFGTTVNFWMYGGDPLINSWIDTYFVPGMYKEHGITVNVVPKGAPFAVASMQAEIADGNTANGGVDMGECDKRRRVM
jgi:ABC-type uncharacterized transport system YnjBCD substrate-binding protein